jgi:hypothetical protein
MTKHRFLPLLVAAIMIADASPSLADTNINKSKQPSQEAAARFTKVIDDLPLMPGLTPQEDEDVLFVAGPGRIAQTTASGPVDIDEVYNFYAKSLPQLGWKKIDARTYERDNERLKLDVSGVNPAATTIVRFSVEPVGKTVTK